jgi:predicted CopG family antitoxin
VNTLREIETSNSEVIESLFEYKKNHNEEVQEEAKKVARDFKSGMMDPGREMAKYHSLGKKNKKK